VQQELFPKALTSDKASRTASGIHSQDSRDMPEGFAYQSEFMTAEEESHLLSEISRLDFQPFDFHGYEAKRRIVSYGFEYDFGSRRTSPAEPIPAFLEPLRQRAAAWTDIRASEIAESIVIEYPPRAPIGWHRDVPQFEMVIGVSLNSACRMRFKPYGSAGKLMSVTLDPRSIYRMQGPARWAYQHSIPAVKALRYSITFRTLRRKA
jgi:alkylated DNA repair dioxygenase AlkB